MAAYEGPPVIGLRVLVWGVTGSGKTTLARRLGALLGLPVIELDAINWRANWTEAPVDEFRLEVAAAVDAAPDGWVVDGNYRSKLGNTLTSRAETVVWLHLPWRLTFFRLLRRTLGRVVRREELWAGNRESLRTTFLSRESILWWSIVSSRTFVQRAHTNLENASHLRVYELRSPGEVEAFARPIDMRSAAASGEGSLS